MLRSLLLRRRILASFAPPLLLLAGCAEDTAPSAPLAAFPSRAPVVLSTGRGFTRTAAGFTAAGSGLGLAVELPAAGGDAVVLRAPAGGVVRVRERDLHGPARAVDRAVAYPRAGGVSYWSAPAGGAEEWLELEAGAARADRPAAVWEIEGAAITQRGDAVEVQGEGVHLWVTAPIAWAASGARVDASLVVRGDRIELHVDAGGEAVLVDPAWTTAAPLPKVRQRHASASLLDGRVLVMGGTDDGKLPFNTTYAYDPVTDAWSAGAPTTQVHADAAAVTLDDGTVLLTGGQDANGVTAVAELYDPVADTWTLMGMPQTHALHTATVLSDGRVLVAGGRANGGSGKTFITAAADVYNPGGGSGGWTAVSDLGIPRVLHAATRLDDGSVLVTGGMDDFGNIVGAIEIFQPGNDGWLFPELGSLESRMMHTATKLADGRVLIVGGDNGGAVPVATAEIYDPSGFNFTAAASLSGPRARHSAGLLPDGTVIVAGGFDGQKALATTEIYDPISDTWSPGPLLLKAHHSATMVPYGGGQGFLLAGGLDKLALADVELLALTKPLGAPCVADSECSSVACSDGVCCDAACNGGCVACTAALRGDNGKDGFCGPTVKGADPHGLCVDQGPGSCGTDGTCDGAGACAFYANGSACDDGESCTNDSCQNGACVGTSKLDGTLCPGGVCIAGACLLDPFTLSSSSSSGTATGGRGGAGGEGGAGGAPSGTGGAPSSSSSGSSGALADTSIHGGGCNVGGGEGRATLVAAAIALLVARRRRRR